MPSDGTLPTLVRSVTYRPHENCRELMILGGELDPPDDLCTGSEDEVQITIGDGVEVRPGEIVSLWSDGEITVRSFDVQG